MGAAAAWLLAAVVAAVALALACSVASAAPSQSKSSHISAVESAFGVRLGRSGGGAVGGRTGPSNAPTVPVGQTFNETLQLALAKGMITQAQIDAICEFKFGMYSYYWAVVGDPLTSVRVGVLWSMFGMFACGVLGRLVPVVPVGGAYLTRDWEGLLNPPAGNI
jgi:hypothetical protein